jgi:inward rectifier potassium channel
MQELVRGSPLAPFDAAALERDQARLVVSFVGLDASRNQTLHARWSYVPSEILLGHRYVDVITVREGGFRSIDCARIDQKEPSEP